jgi:hypothetical protein
MNRYFYCLLFFLVIRVAIPLNEFCQITKKKSAPPVGCGGFTEEEEEEEEERVTCWC